MIGGCTSGRAGGQRAGGRTGERVGGPAGEWEDGIRVNDLGYSICLMRLGNEWVDDELGDEIATRLYSGMG